MDDEHGISDGLKIQLRLLISLKLSEGDYKISTCTKIISLHFSTCFNIFAWRWCLDIMTWMMILHYLCLCMIFP